MKRQGALRRLVGCVITAALVLALAAPARAQFDPMTIGLILTGVQLLSGAVAAIGIGVSQDSKPGIAMPYGTPCGIVDGVPQICWQPYAGGFEGSPDLPTHGSPAPPPQQVEPLTPGLTLTLNPSQAQGQ
jgi:hypothetical protein